MDADFWHERWRRGQTAFHEAEGNALLARHLGALSLAPGARVFVPLAGKTRDIARLLDLGYAVAATELERSAVEALLAELDIPWSEPSPGHITAPRLDIFVGDHFALTAERLGPVAAVYDRAAAVALPSEMRSRYAAGFATLAPACPHLLITLEYDQSLTAGPPFSVPPAEVHRLFAATHRPQELQRGTPEGGLRDLETVAEVAWLLTPHTWD